MALVILGLTLLAVCYAPVHVRDGRAVLLIVGLLAMAACRWTNAWRQAAFAAVLCSFLYRFSDAGWAVVFGCYLAGEAIEGLKASPATHRLVLGLVAVLALGLSIHALLQRAGVVPWHTDVVVGTYASLDNPATLGAFLAIAAPAVTWWALPLLVFAAALAFSTTASVALAAGLVTLLVLSRWRWVVPAVVLATAATVAFVVFYDADPASVIQRGGVWLWTLEQSRGAWLLGYGPGSFSALGLSEAGQPVWRQAHNEFVQWQYEIGLAGTLTIGAYLASLSRSLWRRRQEPLTLSVASMLVALAVSACGHFVFHLAPTAALGIVTLGIAEARA